MQRNTGSHMQKSHKSTKSEAIICNPSKNATGFVLCWPSTSESCPYVWFVYLVRLCWIKLFFFICECLSIGDSVCSRIRGLCHFSISAVTHTLVISLLDLIIFPPLLPQVSLIPEERDLMQISYLRTLGFCICSHLLLRGSFPDVWILIDLCI